MRVARTGNTRYSQWSSWSLPWWANRERRRSQWPSGYPADFEPPAFFDIDDFEDLPEAEYGWREIDTWAIGGLGLFARETEPMPRVIGDGHRVGLEFDTETGDMTDAAVPMLTAMFDGVTCHTEFPYGWTSTAYSRSASESKGLTDIVVCAFDWPAYHKRRRIVGDATLNDKWGYFKSYRHIDTHGPFTAATWLERGPYSDRYLKEIWEFLAENGFLATNGVFGGYWTTMPLPDHIKAAHAIELKQSNWREALEQAERATYADYRWVGLDAGHLRTARENLDAFEKAGVGLLGIARGGVIQLADAAYNEPEGSLDRDDLRERSIAQLRPDDVEQPADDGDDDQADEVMQMHLDGFG